MNFFGLHTYPQGGVGPEPLVWIGRPGDVGPDGRVKAAYPSRHFVTSNSPPAWGAQPMKTGDYAFGAAVLFDRDDYGADYMRDASSLEQAARSRLLSPVRPHGRRAPRRLLFRPPAGREDLHRHRDTVDDSCQSPRATAGRGQKSGRSGGGASGLRRDVRSGSPRRTRRLLLALDARGLDLERVQRCRDQGHAGRLPRGPGGHGEGEVAVTLATCGWVLGPAAVARLVRRVAAQDHAHELHQPHGGQFAGGTRFPPRHGPAEMVDPVDGRRSGHDHAATMGRPHAPRRRRLAGLRLHGPDGHPLADPHPRAQRLGPGPGRLGPAGLEPRPRHGPRRLGRFARRPGGRIDRGLPRQQDRRHARRPALPDGPLQHERLSPQGAQRLLHGDPEVLRTGLQCQGQAGLRRNGAGEDLGQGPRRVRPGGPEPRLRSCHERRPGDQRPAEDRVPLRSRVPVHRRDCRRGHDRRHEPVPRPTLQPQDQLRRAGVPGL